jgi:hypothetical protein
MSTLFKRLQDAIEFAEGIEGAESREEYSNAMRLLADECLRRADVCDAVARDEAQDAMCDWYWKNGWTIEHTGGGCEAFKKELDGGGFVLVTDENDPCLPASLDAPVTCGYYTNTDTYLDGQCAGFIYARNINEALPKIEAGQWEDCQ